MAVFTQESAYGARDADTRRPAENEAPSQTEFDENGGNALQRNSLISTIQGEIIPRLMLAHQNGHHAEIDDHLDGSVSDTNTIERLTRLVVRNDMDGARRHIEALRSDGRPLESIYLDILSPTAKCLGELWKTEQLDFTEVTIGMWGLHSLMRDLGAQFLNESHAPINGRRILLAAAPGEQHFFGVTMAADFFQRAGWSVFYEPSPDKLELVYHVGNEYFDVVGLSLSCGTLVEPLPDVIDSVRDASLNRNVVVMVGGRVFDESPDLVHQVGADASAADGLKAIRLAEDLVGDSKAPLCTNYVL